MTNTPEQVRQQSSTAYRAGRTAGFGGVMRRGRNPYETRRGRNETSPVGKTATAIRQRAQRDRDADDWYAGFDAGKAAREERFRKVREAALMWGGDDAACTETAVSEWPEAVHRTIAALVDEVSATEAVLVRERRQAREQAEADDQAITATLKLLISRLPPAAVAEFRGLDDAGLKSLVMAELDALEGGAS